MKNDRLCGIFGLLFAAYILKEGFAYDLGDLHGPGPGFFPLLGGMLLALFSTILLLQSVMKKTETSGKQDNVPGEKENLRVVGYLVIALVIYALLFEQVGFIINTFFLVGYLLWLLERKRWWVIALTAGVISSASYVIFSVFLKSELPLGILGVFF